MKRIVIAIALLMMTTVMNAQDFAFDEVTYTPEQTTFKLFAPNDAKKVLVRLYQDGQNKKVLKSVKMQRTGDNLWTATVKGDWMSKFYTFDMGRGECPGVFAKAVGVNGRRGAIIDWKAVSPAGW